MQLSFSRGFSHGFLDGTNHKVLVRGDHAKKRGILIGEVESIGGAGVRLDRLGSDQAGRWSRLRRRRIDRPGRTGRARVSGDSTGGCAGGAKSHDDGNGEGATGPLELRFGRGDIDLQALERGQRVWKTDDPELTRRLRRSFEGPPARKVDLDVVVRAIVGEPLCITGRTSIGGRGRGRDGHAAGAGRSTRG